ncbi:MAG: hypothetical protein PVH41_08870 [Anaerolineae bacterium]|jgi:hypothetical protein
MDQTDTASTDAQWRRVFRLGGVAGLIAVVVVVAEMGITFLPGGSTSAETVVDWFELLQDNWFIGLRNLGLMNLIFTVLGIPVWLALYGAHCQGNRLSAALALIVSTIGLAVFLATNRALAMLDLSRQYAAATTDAQRMILESAGQAMLSVGESHVPGTFLGFFLSEVAGIMISVVMWRGRVFSRPTAAAGALGFGLLLIYDILASFVPGSQEVALIPAMVGGLLNVAWYTLTARRLLRLARQPLRQ